MSKLKKVVYELIGRDELVGEPMYQLLDRTIHEHHEQLRHARIVLAWAKSWKRDKDGHLVLGKCKRASDLDRELAEFDFIILLNKDFWQGFATKDTHRAALIDHELCHAAPALDKFGHQLEDERGRKVWRTRKHDIEEFAEIVERHGTYKRDLEEFHRCAIRGVQQQILLAEQETHEQEEQPRIEKKGNASAKSEVKRAVRNLQKLAGEDDASISIGFVDPKTGKVEKGVTITKDDVKSFGGTRA